MDPGLNRHHVRDEPVHMNGEPLGEPHGPPMQLRVENQPGFKMVKWIRAIEYDASRKSFDEGEGGYNEDHEYCGELANRGVLCQCSN